MTTERAPRWGRLWVAAFLVFAAGVMLVTNWYNYQVSRFRHYAQLAHENQLSVLPVEPPRGLIVDRNGEELAVNEKVYSLSVGSDFAADVLGKIDVLRRVVDISERTEANLAKLGSSDVYRGVILLREKLSEPEVARFLGWRFLFPEIVLESELARHYPYGDSAGHVIGYVGRMSDRDQQRLRQEGLATAYRGARFIGKTGVESEYESILRGTLGVQQAQVDAHGRIFGRSMYREPLPGDNIELTIDMRWQRIAEELLGNENGAAVMMDVRTGELLVLASSPRFDINHFVFGISSAHWNILNTSTSKPLIHRAIYGQYAPGSTIKPFLALSALQLGWRDKDYQYESIGYFQMGENLRFHDWKKGGHGLVDIHKSIVRSVNSFYYQLGYEVGIESLHDALQPFGFGAVSGIDLDNEKSGVLPTPAWKQKVFQQPWFPGETISASVGQGYVQVTPLQMAVAVSMLANGGRRLLPYVYRQRGEEQQVVFDEEHLQLVRSALAGVTRPGGTAVQVGSGAPYAIAGKTGTAQVSKLRFDSDGNRVKNEDLKKNLRDHAWFVGYAPVTEPQVAVAVIVENGGSGGKVAGPIARKLLDGYFIEGGNLPAVDESADELAAESVDINTDTDSDAVENADVDSELQVDNTVSLADEADSGVNDGAVSAGDTSGQ